MKRVYRTELEPVMLSDSRASSDQRQHDGRFVASGEAHRCSFVLGAGCSEGEQG